MNKNALEKLKIYKNLLIKWQDKINLISSSTLKNIEQEHFEGSAFLYPYCEKEAKILIDLGSGAGFPGLVLSILNETDESLLEKKEIHLVESDLRKTIFLQEVARKCHIHPTIHRERIENIDLKADIITARALAPLKKLLDYSFPFFKENTYALFLKGDKIQEEIKEALQKYSFKYEIIPNKNKGHLLKIMELKK